MFLSSRFQDFWKATQHKKSCLDEDWENVKLCKELVELYPESWVREDV